MHCSGEPQTRLISSKVRVCPEHKIARLRKDSSVKMSDYTKVINDVVIGEHKIISYPLLSRLLNIEVTEAREYLTKYVKEYKGSLSKTYLLSGSTESFEHTDATPQSVAYSGKCKIMAVVSESELEEKKKLFDNSLQIHLYSISEANSGDIMGLMETVRSKDEIDRSKSIGECSTAFGIFANPDLADSFSEIGAAVYAGSNIKLMAPKKAARPAPVKAEEDSKQTAVPKDEKPMGVKGFFARARAAKTKETSNVSINATSDASNSKSASNATSESSGRSKSNPLGFQRRDTPPDIIKDKVVIDDHNFDNGHESDVELIEDSKAEEERNKLKELFDNDKTAEDDIEAEDDYNDDAMDIDHIDVSAKDEELKDNLLPATVSAASEPVVPEHERQPTNRKRKRKLIKEKKTSVDEDGYLNTVFVDTWVSCSEDDEPAPVKAVPKKQGPISLAKIPPRRDGSVQQQAKLNFFAKRK